MHVVCDSCHGTVAEFSNCNTYPVSYRFAVWTFTAKFCWTPHESNLPSIELMMVLSWQYASVVSSSLGIVLLQWHWILYNKTLFGKQTYFSKYRLYAMLPIFSKAKQYAGSITGALYSLSVLVSCIAVKDTSQLLLRSNMSVSSCCLSAVAREMLKLCPKHFHVWGSKLKSGCIIFMAAEKNQELWKLTRLLKLSLWWCICYICLCSIGQRT